MTASPTAPNPEPPHPPGANRNPAADEGSPEPLVAMKRTGWDVALGVVLIVAGVLILGDVVIASVVSVLFLGWTLLLSGAVMVVLALFRVGKGDFWIGMLSGAVSLVAGLVFVRNPGVTLLALSLAAGALLIAGGVTRAILALQEPEHRTALLVSGVLSVVLGLMILNRWPESALWLLGTLLGIQLVVDGLLLMVLGRLRLTA